MKQDYRGFELNAKREKSMGGDDFLFFFIMRKSDKWLLTDSFTSGDETPREYMKYLKAQVDEYYQKPLEWVSENDMLIVESVIDELLPTFTPEQIGALFAECANGRKEASQ